jgi:general secretion pathway protein A
MGQPELDMILNRPQCRQLKQRVSLRYHIRPLKKEETRDYIEQRLRTAGATRPNYFSPKAIDEIHRYSKGIPRLINVLCDNALLLGYAIDEKVIRKSMIREVIKDLDGFPRGKIRRYLFAAVLLALVSIGLGLIVYWWGDDLIRISKGFLGDVLPKYKQFFERLFRGVL